MNFRKFMSPIGTKRTLSSSPGISAQGAEADVGAGLQVCY